MGLRDLFRRDRYPEDELGRRIRPAVDKAMDEAGIGEPDDEDEEEGTT